MILHPIHKQPVEMLQREKLSLVRMWARKHGIFFQETKYYRDKKRLWIFTDDTETRYTVDQAFDKINNTKTEHPKKRVRCKQYNIIRGYAQAHNMSVRKLDLDENGNQLWQLLSSETREELTGPMTIEEFKRRKENGDTFHKRYFQPSLLLLK